MVLEALLTGEISITFFTTLPLTFTKVFQAHTVTVFHLAYSTIVEFCALMLILFLVGRVALFTVELHVFE